MRHRRANELDGKTEAYRKGFHDGSIPGKAYNPPWNATFEQILDYRDGYREADYD